ncbi:CBS domain-containing protein [Haloferax namakaokahaiae]|uniref:CBS domain-containing protein n=1 Tax=Haloferax namakaokahaiae TaxID=1748331 RepID=A0ABD5ZDM4_9EURY
MHHDQPHRQNQWRQSGEYPQQSSSSRPTPTSRSPYPEQGQFQAESPPGVTPQQVQQGYNASQGQYWNTPQQPQYGHPEQYGQQQQQDPYGQQRQVNQQQQPAGQPPQGSQYPPQGYPQQGQQAPPAGGPQSQSGGPPQQWHQPPSHQATDPQAQQPQHGRYQQPGIGTESTRAGRSRPQLQPVTVEELIATDVVTADPDTPIDSVAKMMHEADVGSVVVVEGERPVGIITDRTLGLMLRDPSKLEDMTAGDCIQDDLVTGTTELSVFDALRRLEDAGVRRLPIVDEDGEKLEGIVTLDDILVLFESELATATGIIKAQSPRL